MATRMQQRRGTAAEWAAQNPVLGPGEIGFETDTKVIKIGDGETAWNDLSLSPLTASGTVMTGPLVVLEPTEPDHAARIGDVVGLVDAVTLDSLPDTDLTGAEEGEAVILGPGGMWIPGPGGGGDASVEIETHEVVGSDAWANINSMPNGRHSPASVSYQGFVYVMLGESSGTATLYRFDPDSGIWTTLASAPTNRNILNHHGVVLGDRIHVAGGHTGSASSLHHRYTPATNTWDSRTALPTAVWGAGGGVVNGIYYIVAGTTGTVANTNQSYDPASNTWTGKAVIPTGARDVSSAVVDGYLYIIGGLISGYTDNNYRYDPGANSWSTRAVLPVATRNLTAAVINDKIHILGGQTAGGIQANHYVYDPSTDLWGSLAPLPEAREYGTASVVSGVIYLAGGNTPGVTGTSTARAYAGVSDPFITLESPAIITSIHPNILLINATKEFFNRTVGGDTGDEIKASGNGSLTVVRAGGS